MHGGRAYDAKWGVRQTGSGPYAALLAQRFKLACSRLGLNTRQREPLDISQFRIPPASGDQLSLI